MAVKGLPVEGHLAAAAAAAATAAVSSVPENAGSQIKILGPCDKYNQSYQKIVGFFEFFREKNSKDI